MDQVAMGVRIWWFALCVVTALNLGLWTYSCFAFLRRKTNAPKIYAMRFPHVLLSLGYVLGCGFRSLLPRADVQRICLYDSFFSSVLVGRSVATVAELCFVAQWALLVNELSKAENDRFGITVSRIIFPAIMVAETCSWYAVLTTNYLGNACEQSLWTLSAGLVGYAMFRLWKRAAPGDMRRFLAVSVVVCAGFVLFMANVDVPMYLSRWHTDQAQGRVYLSILEGLADVSQRWVVTHGWQDWREEIAWMSLYFSFAVWMSISLTHAPHAARSGRGSAFPLSPTAKAKARVSFPRNPLAEG